MALFLFVVFLLFAVIHLVERPETEGHGALYTSVDQAVTGQQRELAGLQAERKAAATDKRRAQLDTRIASAQDELNGLERLKQSGVTKWAAAPAVDGRTNIAWLDHAIAKFRANPDLAIYKLQMSAYKYSWLLIPISVPLVWLLFLFSRRFRLYDHTVFVTYSLAFMTLFAGALTLLDRVVPSLIGNVGMIVPPIHIYRQVRGTYGTSRSGALWRTLALVILAVTALTLFTLALLSMGLLG